MARCGGGNNQGILLLATLAALRLAQELSADELATLAAFFEVLGDNLGLLIAPPCWGQQEEDN